jgi:hypothetical protein
MHTRERIEFEEVSSRAKDFLHELNDPSLLRAKNLPPEVSVEIRRQQILKIQENISVLLAKREEFNRRMDEYMENLKSLMRSIERGLEDETKRVLPRGDSTDGAATMVRCLNCDTQRVFKDLQVVFARESEESFMKPTEVYVLSDRRLKKGRFRCASCGAENLLIRSL